MRSKAINIILLSFLLLLALGAQQDWRVCIRVVDGDTIILDGGERVRLIGVDTPETKDPRKPVE
jgi:endonuclease YncB( thermonuclease family)